MKQILSRLPFNFLILSLFTTFISCAHDVKRDPAQEDLDEKSIQEQKSPHHHQRFVPHSR